MVCLKNKILVTNMFVGEQIYSEQIWTSSVILKFHDDVIATKLQNIWKYCTLSVAFMYVQHDECM